MSRSARFPLSDHSDGRLFFTPGAPPLPTVRDILRWQRSRQAAPWPTQVPIHAAPFSPAPAGSPRLHVTWINHSSFLLEKGGHRLLIDPVYSTRCGPWGRFGPKRVHPPGIPWDHLPRIDAVLLTHDHYDHCDLPTLARLARRHAPAAVTPLGNGTLLRRAGLTEIVELDWGQDTTLAGGVQVTVTPSQHWSNRLTGTRNARLWGGFHLRWPDGTTLYCAGDTGYHRTLFRQIRTTLGEPDVALLPIGAYEPRWFMRGQHCNPQEAVQIHRDVGARRSIAMHWGTFQLTDEARETPPRALQAARAEAGLEENAFRILEPGETLLV